MPATGERREDERRPPVLGPEDVARLLHVKRETVYTWKHRRVMPEPDWTISGRPAWSHETIEVWARATGRWPRNGTTPD